MRGTRPRKLCLLCKQNLRDTQCGKFVSLIGRPRKVRVLANTPNNHVHTQVDCHELFSERYRPAVSETEVYLGLTLYSCFCISFCAWLQVRANSWPSTEFRSVNCATRPDVLSSTTSANVSSYPKSSVQNMGILPQPLLMMRHNDNFWIFVIFRLHCLQLSIFNSTSRDRGAWARFFWKSRSKTALNLHSRSHFYQV